jgi:hypothetical protein
MSGTSKTTKPPKPSEKKPSKDNDELYDDGDFATPKRDVSEEEIKEQEDKRL